MRGSKPARWVIYVPEAATWRVTFNVPMDTRNDRPVTRRLALHASTLAFP